MMTFCFIVQHFEILDNQHVVQLHQHNSRFMNLQRHVWSCSDNGKFELQFVNPMSAVSVDFLRGNGFKTAALPMTPRDMFTLWEALDEACSYICPYVSNVTLL